MDRFLCQLCNTIVRCGEKHPCFIYSNDDDFFTIHKPAESEETNKKPDSMSEEIFTGYFVDSSVTKYSNLREKNVEETSTRKGKYPSLFAGNCNNPCSISSRNSLLEWAVSNQKCEVSSRENDCTSQAFWNSEKVKSPSTLANTVFPLCKNEPGELDPTEDILDTSISTRADIDSFSSNSNVEFNSKQSQESMKDSAVAGVPAIRPRLHTSDGKRKHTCDLCPKQFECKDSLIHHYRTHTEENSYKCDTCGKQFSRKGHLETHQLTHTGLKPFKCDICGKEFNQKGNLNTHYRIHTGEKPFKCETCGQRFTQKVSLDAHSRTHTGERPFECDICNKTFAANSSLRRHAKDAHTQETF